jgi:hypothetical protein
MKLLTLLVVVVTLVGGPPGATRHRKERHETPIFTQASITLFRVEGGESRQVAAARGGTLRTRVRPGRYVIKSLANDTPAQAPNPPCGSTRQPQSFKPGGGFAIRIKPGVRRVHVTLKCRTK